MIEIIKTFIRKFLTERQLETFKYYLAKYTPLLEDVPPGDDVMSPRAAALFSHRKYLEQNLNTPVKYAIQLLHEEICLRSTYFGVHAVKSPTDFWVYMEIIHKVKPDVIIEIGNYCGGSTLALAHILDNIGSGRIIGIDIDHSNVPLIVKNHPRIHLITGDACKRVSEVKSLIKDGERILVIEDSSHEYQNTLNVLRAFGPLVTKGSYLIVEDSYFHHGLEIGPNPGPYEAIGSFMKENRDFEIDRSRERFLITCNPKGYLRRIS